MALADEGNIDLAFNTVTLRDCGNRYCQIAQSLRTMASRLDACLDQLKNSGWTTPAGTAFHKMAETNWEDNINKYADLLDTLNEILQQAATDYDNLVIYHIENTKI